jgi:hypothetical protein
MLHIGACKKFVHKATKTTWNNCHLMLKIWFSFLLNLCNWGTIYYLKGTVYRFANLDIDKFFLTYRKHRFFKLVILQIPKNRDLSKSNNRKKVIEPSIANHEKNIGCPPLHINIYSNEHILDKAMVKNRGLNHSS